jgi:hypothetical protein
MSAYFTKATLTSPASVLLYKHEGILRKPADSYTKRAAPQLERLTVYQERGYGRMFVRDYEWYIRHLAEHVHMNPWDVVIVENVAEWCEEHGLPERDGNKPLKLVSGNGAGTRMLIAEMILDEVIEERVNALRIRSQLKSVGFDRAELLNSRTKKLAYLFLKEYASSIQELANDELAADDWVFEQMNQLGMFNP